MDWKKLLCKDRFSKDVSDPVYDPRSSFQRDIDRILFSSPFRRMQDKTQVFPIPKSDFIHNRLTHSVEVASVGRSLGLLAGDFVLKQKEESLLKQTLMASEGYVPDDFATIVQAACLAHDIGNPPFGHSGEKAIGSFFMSEAGRKITEKLTNEERLDLECFEGNAAGFRILTHIAGLELTYATLGAFTKYPWSSSTPVDVDTYRIKDKFGFFYSDREKFQDVAKRIGLVKKDAAGNIWSRHPLSFLMEAADTICYRVIDIEDSVKLRLLDSNTAIELLEAICKKTPEEEDLYKPKIREKVGEKNYLAYVRAKAISSLIYQAFAVWEKYYDDIMVGDFNKELLDLSPSKNELDRIKNTLKKNSFNHPIVLKIELAGYEVLGGLLGEFVGAALGIFDESKMKKLKALLPEQYLKDGDWHADLPECMLLITDFVSNMTDSYAIDLYRSLKGISLSTIE